MAIICLRIKEAFQNEQEEMPANPKRPEIEQPADPGKPDVPQEDPQREAPDAPPPVTGYASSRYSTVSARLGCTSFIFGE